MNTNQDISSKPTAQFMISMLQSSQLSVHVLTTKTISISQPISTPLFQHQTNSYSNSLSATTNKHTSASPTPVKIVETYSGGVQVRITSVNGSNLLPSRAALIGMVDVFNTATLNWRISVQNGSLLSSYIPLLSAVTLPYCLINSLQGPLQRSPVSPNSTISAITVLKYPSGLTVTMRQNASSNPMEFSAVLFVEVDSNPLLPDIKDYPYSTPLSVPLQLNETTPGVISGSGALFGNIQVNMALTFSPMYTRVGAIPSNVNATLSQLMVYNDTSATFSTSALLFTMQPVPLYSPSTSVPPVVASTLTPSTSPSPTPVKSVETYSGGVQVRITSVNGSNLLPSRAALIGMVDVFNTATLNWRISVQNGSLLSSYIPLLSAVTLPYCLINSLQGPLQRSPVSPNSTISAITVLKYPSGLTVTMRQNASSNPMEFSAVLFVEVDSNPLLPDIKDYPYSTPLSVPLQLNETTPGVISGSGALFGNIQVNMALTFSPMYTRVGAIPSNVNATLSQLMVYNDTSATFSTSALLFTMQPVPLYSPSTSVPPVVASTLTPSTSPSPTPVKSVETYSGGVQVRITSVNGSNLLPSRAALIGMVDVFNTATLNWRISVQNGSLLSSYIPLLSAVTLPYCLINSLQGPLQRSPVSPNSTISAITVLKYPSGLTVSMKQNASSNPLETSVVLFVEVDSNPLLPDIKDYPYSTPLSVPLQLNETTPGVISGSGALFGNIQVNVALTFSPMYTRVGAIPTNVNATLSQLMVYNDTSATFSTSAQLLTMQPVPLYSPSTSVPPVVASTLTPSTSPSPTPVKSVETYSGGVQVRITSVNGSTLLPSRAALIGMVDVFNTATLNWRISVQNGSLLSSYIPLLSAVTLPYCLINSLQGPLQRSPVSPNSTISAITVLKYPSGLTVTMRQNAISNPMEFSAVLFVEVDSNPLLPDIKDYPYSTPLSVPLQLNETTPGVISGSGALFGNIQVNVALTFSPMYTRVGAIPTNVNATLSQLMVYNDTSATFSTSAQLFTMQPVPLYSPSTSVPPVVASTLTPSTSPSPTPVKSVETYSGGVQVRIISVNGSNLLPSRAALIGMVDVFNTATLNWRISVQNGSLLSSYIPLLSAVTLPYCLINSLQGPLQRSPVSPNSTISAITVLKYPSGLTVSMKQNASSNPLETSVVLFVEVDSNPLLPDIKDYPYSTPLSVPLQLNETTPGVISGIGALFGNVQVNVALTFSPMYTRVGAIPTNVNATLSQLMVYNDTSATFSTSALLFTMQPVPLYSPSTSVPPVVASTLTPSTSPPPTPVKSVETYSGGVQVRITSVNGSNLLPSRAALIGMVDVFNTATLNWRISVQNGSLLSSYIPLLSAVTLPYCLINSLQGPLQRSPVSPNSTISAITVLKYPSGLTVSMKQNASSNPLETSVVLFVEVDSNPLLPDIKDYPYSTPLSVPLQLNETTPGVISGSGALFGNVQVNVALTFSPMYTRVGAIPTNVNATLSQLMVYNDTSATFSTSAQLFTMQPVPLYSPSTSVPPVVASTLTPSTSPSPTPVKSVETYSGGVQVRITSVNGSNLLPSRAALIGMVDVFNTATLNWRISVQNGSLLSSCIPLLSAVTLPYCLINSLQGPLQRSPVSPNSTISAITVLKYPSGLTVTMRQNAISNPMEFSTVLFVEVDSNPLLPDIKDYPYSTPLSVPLQLNETTPGVISGSGALFGNIQVNVALTFYPMYTRVGAIPSNVNATLSQLMVYNDTSATFSTSAQIFIMQPVPLNSPSTSVPPVVASTLTPSTSPSPTPVKSVETYSGGVQVRITSVNGSNLLPSRAALIGMVDVFNTATLNWRISVQNGSLLSSYIPLLSAVTLPYCLINSLQGPLQRSPVSPNSTISAITVLKYPSGLTVSMKQNASSNPLETSVVLFVEVDSNPLLPDIKDYPYSTPLSVPLQLNETTPGVISGSGALFGNIQVNVALTFSPMYTRVGAIPTNVNATLSQLMVYNDTSATFSTSALLFIMQPVPLNSPSTSVPPVVASTLTPSTSPSPTPVKSVETYSGGVQVRITSVNGSNLLPSRAALIGMVDVFNTATLNWRISVQNGSLLSSYIPLLSAVTLPYCLINSLQGPLQRSPVSPNSTISAITVLKYPSGLTVSMKQNASSNPLETSVVLFVEVDSNPLLPDIKDYPYSTPLSVPLQLNETTPGVISGSGALFGNIQVNVALTFSPMYTRVGAIPTNVNATLSQLMVYNDTSATFSTSALLFIMQPVPLNSPSTSVPPVVASTLTPSTSPSPTPVKSVETYSGGVQVRITSVNGSNLLPSRAALIGMVDVFNTATLNWRISVQNGSLLSSYIPLLSAVTLPYCLINSLQGPLQRSPVSPNSTISAITVLKYPSGLTVSMKQNASSNPLETSVVLFVEVDSNPLLPDIKDYPYSTPLSVPLQLNETTPGVISGSGALFGNIQVNVALTFSPMYTRVGAIPTNVNATLSQLMVYNDTSATFSTSALLFIMQPVPLNSPSTSVPPVVASTLTPSTSPSPTPVKSVETYSGGVQVRITSVNGSNLLPSRAALIGMVDVFNTATLNWRISVQNGSLLSSYIPLLSAVTLPYCLINSLQGPLQRSPVSPNSTISAITVLKYPSGLTVSMKQNASSNPLETSVVLFVEVDSNPLLPDIKDYPYSTPLSVPLQLNETTPGVISGSGALFGNIQVNVALTFSPMYTRVGAIPTNVNATLSQLMVYNDTSATFSTSALLFTMQPVPLYSPSTSVPPVVASTLTPSSSPSPTPVKSVETYSGGVLVRITSVNGSNLLPSRAALIGMVDVFNTATLNWRISVQNGNLLSSYIPLLSAVTLPYCLINSLQGPLQRSPVSPNSTISAIIVLKYPSGLTVTMRQNAISNPMEFSAVLFVEVDSNPLLPDIKDYPYSTPLSVPLQLNETTPGVISGSGALFGNIQVNVALTFSPMYTRVGAIHTDVNATLSQLMVYNDTSATFSTSAQLFTMQPVPLYSPSTSVPPVVASTLTPSTSPSPTPVKSMETYSGGVQVRITSVNGSNWLPSRAALIGMVDVFNTATLNWRISVQNESLLSSYIPLLSAVTLPYCLINSLQGPLQRSPVSPNSTISAITVLKYPSGLTVSMKQNASSNPLETSVVLFVEVDSNPLLPDIKDYPYSTPLSVPLQLNEMTPGVISGSGALFGNIQVNMALTFSPMYTRVGAIPTNVNATLSQLMVYNDTSATFSTSALLFIMQPVPLNSPSTSVPPVVASTLTPSTSPSPTPVKSVETYSGGVQVRITSVNGSNLLPSRAALIGMVDVFNTATLNWRISVQNESLLSSYIPLLSAVTLPYCLINSLQGPLQRSPVSPNSTISAITVLKYPSGLTVSMKQNASSNPLETSVVLFVEVDSNPLLPDIKDYPYSTPLSVPLQLNETTPGVISGSGALFGNIQVNVALTFSPMYTRVGAIPTNVNATLSQLMVYNDTSATFSTSALLFIMQPVPLNSPSTSVPPVVASTLTPSSSPSPTPVKSVETYSGGVQVRITSVNGSNLLPSRAALIGMVDVFNTATLNWRISVQNGSLLSSYIPLLSAVTLPYCLINSLQGPLQRSPVSPNSTISAITVLKYPSGLTVSIKQNASSNPLETSVVLFVEVDSNPLLPDIKDYPYSTPLSVPLQLNETTPGVISGSGALFGNIQVNVALTFSPMYTRVGAIPTNVNATLSQLMVYNDTSATFSTSALLFIMQPVPLNSPSTSVPPVVASTLTPSTSPSPTPVKSVETYSGGVQVRITSVNGSNLLPSRAALIGMVDVFNTATLNWRISVQNESLLSSYIPLLSAVTLPYCLINSLQGPLQRSPVSPNSTISAITVLKYPSGLTVSMKQNASSNPLETPVVLFVEVDSNPLLPDIKDYPYSTPLSVPLQLNETTPGVISGSGALFGNIQVNVALTFSPMYTRVGAIPTNVNATLSQLMVYNDTSATFSTSALLFIMQPVPLNSPSTSVPPVVASTLTPSTSPSPTPVKSVETYSGGVQVRITSVNGSNLLPSRAALIGMVDVFNTATLNWRISVQNGSLLSSYIPLLSAVTLPYCLINSLQGPLQRSPVSPNSTISAITVLKYPSGLTVSIKQNASSNPLETSVVLFVEVDSNPLLPDIKDYPYSTPLSVPLQLNETTPGVISGSGALFGNIQVNVALTFSPMYTRVGAIPTNVNATLSQLMVYNDTSATFSTSALLFIMQPVPLNSPSTSVPPVVASTLTPSTSPSPTPVKSVETYSGGVQVRITSVNGSNLLPSRAALIGMVDVFNTATLNWRISVQNGSLLSSYIPLLSAVTLPYCLINSLQGPLQRSPVSPNSTISAITVLKYPSGLTVSIKQNASSNPLETSVVLFVEVDSNPLLPDIKDYPYSTPLSVPLQLNETTPGVISGSGALFGNIQVNVALTFSPMYTRVGAIPTNVNATLSQLMVYNDTSATFSTSALLFIMQPVPLNSPSTSVPPVVASTLTPSTSPSPTPVKSVETYSGGVQVRITSVNGSNLLPSTAALIGMVDVFNTATLNWRISVQNGSLLSSYIPLLSAVTLPYCLINSLQGPLQRSPVSPNSTISAITVLKYPSGLTVTMRQNAISNPMEFSAVLFVEVDSNPLLPDIKDYPYSTPLSVPLQLNETTPGVISGSGALFGNIQVNVALTFSPIYTRVGAIPSNCNATLSQLMVYNDTSATFSTSALLFTMQPVPLYSPSTSVPPVVAFTLTPSTSPSPTPVKSVETYSGGVQVRITSVNVSNLLPSRAALIGMVDVFNTATLNWRISVQNGSLLSSYIPLLSAVTLPYCLINSLQGPLQRSPVSPNSTISAITVLKYPSGLTVSMKQNASSNPLETSVVLFVEVDSNPLLPDIKDYPYSTPLSVPLQLNETTPGVISGSGALFGNIQVNVALTFSPMYTRVGAIPTNVNATLSQLMVYNDTSATFSTSAQIFAVQPLPLYSPSSAVPSSFSTSLILGVLSVVPVQSYHVSSGLYITPASMMLTSFLETRSVVTSSKLALLPSISPSLKTSRGVMFNGSSFVEYGTSGSGIIRSFLLTFSFISNRADGLILFSSEFPNCTGSFVSISLHSSSLEFWFSTGTDVNVARLG